MIVGAGWEWAMPVAKTMNNVVSSMAAGRHVESDEYLRIIVSLLVATPHGQGRGALLLLGRSGYL